MKILLLCEPRSGSTNFANWFIGNDFTVLFNPDLEINGNTLKKNTWFQGKLSPSEYKYKTKNLVIKVDFYHDKNYDEFIDSCDKIICLYRENEDDQIQSWINSKKTNNWDRQYFFEYRDDPEEIDFFKELKYSFKKKYLDQDLFSVSYEELYEGKGIYRVIEYLQIEDLKNKKWPIGFRYRLEKRKEKNIF